MRRLLFIPASVFLALSVSAHADKFVNTGPGTINTCDSTGAVGVGISSTDSLVAPDRQTLLMIGANDAEDIGGALQLNMPSGNDSAYAVMFEIYLHGGEIPVLRMLKSTTNGGDGREEISNWNLSTNEFWTRGGMYAYGEIKSDSGFRAGGTALYVPDFVFEPGYRLPDLGETERFVKANRHLPGIPEAADIRKDGMNLADMNLKLLQKVEELTLHAIEQEKRIKALEARLGDASVAAVSRKTME